MKKQIQSIVLRLALILIFGLSLNNAFAAKGMKGTYTIDPKGSGGKNFKTFYDAFNRLVDSGVVGPVVFNIANATYLYDNVYVNYGISGTSSTNTITFQSASGDSSKVRLNCGMSLSYCSWLIFKDMTFYGNNYDVVSLNYSHNFTFTNCQFFGDGSHYLITSTDDTSRANLTITNNFFKGGTVFHSCYGINLPSIYHGWSTTYNNNIFDSATLQLRGDSMTEVRNNSFRNGSILFDMAGQVKITHNVLRNEAYLGIRGSDSIVIAGNQLYAPNTGTTAINISSYFSASRNIVLVNNFVELGGKSATTYSYASAIYISAAVNCKILYNTFYCHSTDLKSFGGYLDGLNYPVIENNIFMADTGYAIGINNLSAIATCDNNDEYSSMGYLGSWDGSDYKTLAGWQSISGLDSNSISKNPQFYSRSDLHIKNSYLSGKAKNIGITEDIDGQKRLATSSTIGADEITGGIAKFGAKSFCVGDSTVFTDSSTYFGIDTIKHWLWTFGDGDSSMLQNPKHLYRSGGNFTAFLKITTMLGVSDSTTRVTYVDTTCEHLLKGIVSTSTSAALKNTKLYLCTYTANDSIVHLIDSTMTDTSGFYSFRTMQDTVYLFAFPTLSAYPHELPTWSDTGVYFPMASSIGLHLGTNNKNFHTIYGANPGGSGLIGGKVTYCYLCKTFGSGNPASGVRVLLADSNGKVQEYTYINSQGYFSFSSIAPTKYKIFVDQPLVKNNPAPVVTIDAANPFATSLGFTLYPTYLSLNTMTGIQSQKENNILNIYPNPASYKLNIEIANPSEGMISITDLNGRIVLMQNINSTNTSLDIAGLAKGLYILKYHDKNEVVNKTFVRE